MPSYFFFISYFQKLCVHFIVLTHLHFYWDSKHFFFLIRAFLQLFFTILLHTINKLMNKSVLCKSLFVHRAKSGHSCRNTLNFFAICTFEPKHSACQKLWFTRLFWVSEWEKLMSLSHTKMELGLAANVNEIWEGSSISSSLSSAE